MFASLMLLTSATTFCRVMGLYSICFSLIPLGGLLDGAVATITSPPFAGALNAGMLTVVAAIATQPALRRLDGCGPGSAAILLDGPVRSGA